MVDASENLDSEEKELIRNIFDFDDLTAGEIATHRTGVTMLHLEDSEAEWDSVIRGNIHSWYPVCGEDVDEVKGVLNSRDYFMLEDKSRGSVMKNAVREAYFVPESVKADTLFKNMKKTKNPIAVVVDEYGGMFGVITINDLVGQLVGDFSTDESVENELPDIVGPDEDDTWLIRGDAMLADVNEKLKLSLSREDSDTFGGYVFSLLGLIPDDGSAPHVETDEIVVDVNDIKDHQVVSARVRVLPKADEDEEDS